MVAMRNASAEPRKGARARAPCSAREKTEEGENNEGALRDSAAVARGYKRGLGSYYTCCVYALKRERARAPCRTREEGEEERGKHPFGALLVCESFGLLVV